MKSLVESINNINERGIETFTKTEIIEELQAIIDEIKESNSDKWKVWFRQGTHEYPSSLVCIVDNGDIIFEM